MADLDIARYIPVFYLHTKETAFPVDRLGSASHPLVYTRVQEFDDTVDVVVVVLFADNPPYKVLGCVEKGGHPGDIEHVRIVVSKESQEIVRVFYSAHAPPEGLWVDRKDIEFEGTRPVVFLAKHSHACYHRPGRHFRIWGLANDLCDRGFTWQPRHVALTLEEPWLREPFYGVSAVFNRRWFHERYEGKDRSKKSAVFRCS